VTCFIAVMGNKGPTIVRIEEPGLPVTVNARVGSVMPLLWSATGRVFLGLLDESSVEALAQEELQMLPPTAGRCSMPSIRSASCASQFARRLRIGARHEPEGHQRRGGAGARLHGPCMRGADGAGRPAASIRRSTDQWPRRARGSRGDQRVAGLRCVCAT
jgi:hypothetical protein